MIMPSKSYLMITHFQSRTALWSFRLVFILILFPVVLLAQSTPEEILFDGGSGTQADPWLISTVQHLQDIKNQPNDKHYRLKNDIDASSTAIGEGFNPIGWFNGSIDGAGFTVTGFRINRSGVFEVAMIKSTGAAAVIKNIKFQNAVITGGTRVGVIVGTNAGLIENVNITGNINGQGNVGGITGQSDGGSLIKNCSFSGNVTANQNYTGGIAGLLNSNANIENASVSGVITGATLTGGIAGQMNSLSTVTNSVVDASVTGTSSVGGITGYNNSGTINNTSSNGNVSGTQYVGGLSGRNQGPVTNCFSNSDVTGTSSDVGGLIGWNNNANVTNSHSTGVVSGTNQVGGLIGLNGYSGTLISNCYSTSDVFGSGGDDVGGLIGQNNGATVELCYSNGKVRGITNVGGLIGRAHSGSLIRLSTSSSEVRPFGTSGNRNQFGGLIGELHASTLQNSYAIGAVYGNNRVGGLIGQFSSNSVIANSYSSGLVSGNAGQTGGMIGRRQGGTISNSFWDTQTSGLTYSDGGTAKNTAQMKDPATFQNAGWNLTAIWTIDPDINNGYPFLAAMGGNFVIVWNGNINTQWENNGNWSNNNVPITTSKVRIPNVPNKPVISTFVAINTLQVQPNSSVTIATNGSLTVTNVVDNAAGNTGILVKSSQAGTGSFVHNTAGVPATFERYVPGLPEAWHMLSSPMTNQPISGTFTPSGSYGDGTGYDFYTWYEPDTSWVYLLNIDYPPNWLTANGSNNFVVGRGYLVSYQAPNPTLVFSGFLNNGYTTIPVTRNPAGTGDPFGSNIIGNPYPSSIDWKSTTGWSRGTLESNGGGYDIWIWNDAAQNYGVYNSASGNDIGTLGITRYIAPTQGFFVSATQTGTVSLNNNTRVHNGSGNWLKSTVEGISRLSMAIQHETAQSMDQVVLEYGHNENQGGSRKKFSFVPSAPSLYLSNGGVDFSLRLLSDTDAHPVVPVSFKPGENGSHSITVSFEELAFEMLVIEDLFTGTKHDLLKNNVYTFTASTKDDPKRFVLHLKEGNFPNPHSPLPINIYSYDRTLFLDLRLMGETETCQLDIFDLTGRKLYTMNVTCGQLKDIFLPQLHGLFIARVTGKNGVKSEKIYLN